MNKEKVYVGIDIAKANLDIALYSSEKKWQFTNDEAGISRVTEFLKELSPVLVVMEATSGYEAPWHMLSKHGEYLSLSLTPGK